MARERVVGIDELLGGEPEPEGPPRPARPEPAGTLASGLFWTVVVAAITAGAAYVVLAATGVKVPYVLLFSLFCALLALRRAIRTVEAPKLTVGAPAGSSDPARIDPTRVADGMELALARWDTRLGWSERDPHRFMSVVRPRLADIAEERLRQRHGVTRDTDPRRARQLLGERLWTFLFEPLTRIPNPRELAAVVDDVEKL
ncbi:hypothetical protein [Planosporangium mesophilum]|uniref:Uncharacterized protein n=1 Tax=Planosporangium mesophilum TaxID=689768 RepID=A0A8J3TCX4_9ACTN|nr:hypothetical protein [Planosporangium mesophilum]NJC84846.1 hypothetical protein [Planosporangium mesophilum]GII24133.1 hypothetical protein Pme01_37300 [Planosporangium mesophilum]